MHYRAVPLNVVVAGVFLAGILHASPALGQVFTPPDARFLDLAPEIGDLVPDVEIVDDQGNPVRLRELAQGHYTVLTLGCLT